jgi:hypothetical protein
VWREVSRVSGPRRREFLGSLVALAAASAGCLSGDGENRAEYTDWVPAENSVNFALVEFDVATETGGDRPGLLPFLLPAPRDSGDEQPVELPNDALIDSEDPLLATPFQVTGAVAASAFFGLSALGLSYLADREDPDTADRVLFVDGVGVVAGPFDTGRADERLRTSSEQPFAETDYEPVDETDRFVYYEPVQGDDALSSVAVGTDRILFAQRREEIERVVELGAGNGTRAVDAVDEFGRMVDETIDGQVVAGWLAPVNERQLLGPPDNLRIWNLLELDGSSFVTSARLRPADGSLTVDITTGAEALGSGSAEFRAQLGGQSREYSVTVENGLLTASGTYGDIPFEPLGQEPAADVPSGDDLPAKVREAVPEGAVEFTDAPNQEDLIRVELGDIQADTVRILSVESDRETTVDSPAATNWVIFSPNPDGDEIKVVATVDNESGVIATGQYPLPDGS